MQFLHTHHICGEVLVCDNGSTDCSSTIASDEGARVIFSHKTGYGNALRYGIEQSYGTYVIMGDCDRSYDFSDLEGMYQALHKGSTGGANHHTNSCYIVL